MAERIAVDPDTVRQHAARVGVVAGDVRLAEQAARSLDLSGGAFGVMCAMLVPPAALVSAVASRAIRSATDLLERAQAELRGAGTDFEELEQAHIEVIRRLARAVDEGGR